MAKGKAPLTISFSNFGDHNIIIAVTVSSAKVGVRKVHLI